MELRQQLRGRLLDWMMQAVNELRAPTLSAAVGDVLEVGFGTGLNLPYYPSTVKKLLALDPKVVEGLPPLDERLRRAAFPVERSSLRADGELPFDSRRFDCVVTTWALCSIPDPLRALGEMRRVLKPDGHYLFIEHGCAPTARSAWWQDQLNPLWCRIADGCNMNRSIDRIVEEGGFELTSLERFRHGGPGLLGHMYRGVATPSA